MKLFEIFSIYLKVILLVQIIIFVQSKEQCFDTSLDTKLNLNSENNKLVCENVKSKQFLSRRKRALLFPDGTRFLITASLVKAILVGIPLGWNVALELDVFYDMHKHDKIVEHNINFIKLQTGRQKREVWDHMEEVLRIYGLDGQPCVLRAICEAQQYLAPKDVSLTHDLLKLLFSASEEEGPRDEYTAAHQTEDCSYYHSKCPFSLLEILLSYQRV